MSRLALALTAILLPILASSCDSNCTTLKTGEQSCTTIDPTGGGGGGGGGGW